MNEQTGSKKKKQQAKTRAPRQTRNNLATQSLSLLHKMFSSLSSTLDETEMLNRTATIISDHFNYAVVAINLLDNSKKQFSLRALAARLPENLKIASTLPLNSGVIGQAAAQRRPVVIADTNKCEFYIEKFPATRSELACPILHGEKLLGVLNVESDHPDAFTEDDVTGVAVLAGALAIAIENARAFKRIQELNETKDALLERLSHDYQHIFENAMQGMSRSTPEGRFLIVNRAFARTLGYDSPEQLLKVDLKNDLYPNPDHRRKLLDMLERDGMVNDFETQFKRCDGQIIDVKINARTVRDTHGRTLYYDGIIEDISAQKQMQQELQRRERMAMMGELAAAIAHEIRNPLAAVLNSAEELQARIELSGTNQRLLEIILEEVGRLERIVRDFLEFARPSEPKFTRADLHQVLEKTLELVAQGQQLRAGIKFEKDFAPELPMMALDPDRMIQVFLNVILNAGQAIKRVGIIRVRTGLKLRAASAPISVSQAEAVVEIMDNGIGIRQDLLGRIFEPFFTTKPSGTGLGLPIAKQIVERHGGSIAIESREGEGSSVRILLPIRENR